MFRVWLCVTAVCLVSGDTLYFRPHAPKDVTCGDRRSTCPDNSTCCVLSGGGYGCCPLPKAVCCADKTHCCPAGSTCDVAAGSCRGPSGISRPWSEKVPARALSARAQYVICDGGMYQCPNGNTCCRQPGGEFGCCPFPKAICCKDGSHCCPHAYTCDLSHGTCVKAGAAKVLLGSVQEALPVATPAKHAKLTIQTNAGMRAKVKEVLSKNSPDKVTKVSKLVAAPVKPSISKVQQAAKTQQKPKKVSKGTAKTAPKEGIAHNTAPQISVKVKVKPGKSLPATKNMGTVKPPKRQTSLPKNATPKASSKAQVSKQQSHSTQLKTNTVHLKQTLKAKAATAKTTTMSPKTTPNKSKKPNTEPKKVMIDPKKPQSKVAKDVGSGKLPTQSGKQAGKVKHKVEKKTKKMLDSITDTIHATMNAIKETVHSVVGRSAKPKVKVPGKKAKSLGIPVKNVQNGAGAKVEGTPQLKQKVKSSTVKPGLASSSKPVSARLKEASSASKTAAKKTVTLAKNLQVKRKTAPNDRKNKQESLKEVWQDKSQIQKHRSQVSVQKNKAGTKKIIYKPETTPPIEDEKATKKLKQKQESLKEIRSLVKEQKRQQQKDKIENKVKSEQQKLLKQQRILQKEIKRKNLQQKPVHQQTLHEHTIKPLSKDKLNAQHKQQQQIKSHINQQQIKQAPQHLKKRESQQQKKVLASQPKHKPSQEMQKQHEQSSLQQKTIIKKLPDKKEQAIGKQAMLEKPQQQKRQQKHQQNKQQQAALGSNKQKGETKAKKRAVPSSASSGHMSVGRKLLGLVWRYLGMKPAEEEVIIKNLQVDEEAAHGWDFPAGMDEDEEFVVEGEELEIVEEAAIALVAEVPCPDKSTCPPDTTCCQLADGAYGCCPMSKAVCCADHIHCCAEGETCDVSAGRCRSKAGVFTSTLRRKVAAASPRPSPGPVTCPGGATCPARTTCCPVSGDTYACCPLPNAVCCSDHAHCCPPGYTCHTAKAQCIKGRLAITWMLKRPVLPKVTEQVPKSTVVCPDQSTCPTGSTCCAMQSGSYGCCPMDHAVCCTDKEHCCPESYTCDPDTAACVRASVSVPWSRKRPARPATMTDIVCPDQKSMCPDEATCCKMENESWGCCPMPDAVCCPDRQHCCPEDTVCNTSKGTCTSTTSSLTVSHTGIVPRRKVDARLAARRTTIVNCRDATECPDGTTCCQNSAGKYACCPHPAAVCCADKLHCCPGGYTCGTKPNECKKGSTTISTHFIARSLAKKPRQQVSDVDCPDAETTCPDGNTCCTVVNGVYGCCPLANAVCCSTGTCCPAGNKCDATGKNCIMSLPWSVRKPAGHAVNSKERSFLKRAAKGGHILY